nr:hypothetical protein [Tanacetum cinerariifolium]
MTPQTFVDTHNMVVFLSKSECLSAKWTAWNEFNYFMASAVICLATSRKFNFSKYIFHSMVRNVDSPSKFLMYLHFLQVVMDHQVDDMTSHNTRYTSLDPTQKVFANIRRVGKGFSGVETPLFAFMLVQPQPQAEEEVEIPLKKRVKKLEKKKMSNSLGFKRLRRVGTAQRVESSTDTILGAQEDASNQGKIAAIDADEDIALVDVETAKEVFAMDAESQERINQEEVNAASKGVSVAEPTVFDDEDVTITMDQTLIKLKVEKAKHLDEQIAQRLHDEEKLYTDCGVHHVSSTRGHDIFMLTEKDYLLSNAIMILMLSGKLQVEEDSQMARDLVMKIFMEAIKPKSRSLDTSS